ncbi:MAG: M14 family metallopeptidase [Bacteroidia bacterium]|nr:M14 family metallopeptidase [Bacteroidia bacterium]
MFTLLLFIYVFSPGGDLTTPFEQSQKTQSATYEEAISYYRQLDKSFHEISLFEYGKTDVGKALHLVVISSDKVFDPVKIRKSGKRIVLINNGIHAGEPCGIDASMMLARDLVSKPEMKKFLENVVVAIIPVYNIGGALNRGCCSRVNQVGPEAYGFRGNAQNLDLNRDFIKADSRNAWAFTEIFQNWQPEVFVDTHTTNGADYQAVLTYLATLPEKADPGIAAYMTGNMIPALENYMNTRSVKICPYVNVFGNSPDKGFSAFLDLPRYSSGYTSLFQTISFISEAHMLKTFEERVNATYLFLEGIISQVNKDHQTIGDIVKNAKEKAKTQTNFDVAWRHDPSVSRPLPFEGYEARYKSSRVTGLQRLYYDRTAPYTKTIPYFYKYNSIKTLQKPTAYIIPQAWREVIERLQMNKVEMFSLKKDTTLSVEVSYITRFIPSPRPYEGHFLHSGVEIKKTEQQIDYYAGDKVVYVNQERNPYIVHVLEPESQDAFFAWNFFDPILMRKEYFSDYLFEEEAEKILEENPDIRESFEEKKAQDSIFSGDARQQLTFIYEMSDYAEKTYNRYPVTRWNGNTRLPH